MLRNPQSVMLVPKLTSTTASCFTPALLRARHLPFSVCASSLSAVTQYQHSRSHYFAHNTFKFTGTSTTPFNDHEQDRGNNDYHPNDDDSDNHVYDHGDHSNSKNNRTSRSNKNSANHTNYTHNNYTLHHNLHHSNNEKYKHKYKHTRKQHCKRAAEIGTPTIGLRWFSSRGAKTPTAMMAGTSSTPKHAQHAQYNNDSKAGRTDTVLGVGAAAPPFVVKGSSGALLSTEDVFGALLYRYPPLYEVKKNPKLWKKHPQYCFKLVARNVGYDSAAVIGRVPGAFASADFTFTTEQSVKVSACICCFLFRKRVQGLIDAKTTFCCVFFRLPRVDVCACARVRACVCDCRTFYARAWYVYTQGWSALDGWLFMFMTRSLYLSHQLPHLHQHRQYTNLVLKSTIAHKASM